MVNDSILFLSYHDKPEDSKYLYCFSISTDFGITWTKPKLLPDFLHTYKVINNSFILIGSGYSLYKSSNMGENWETVNLPYLTYFIRYNQDSSFYAATQNGFFYSKDSSFNWIKLSDISLKKFEILPDGRFLGYNYDNISISDDSGKTWTKSMKGYTAAWIFAVSINQKGDIYCLDGQNCFRTLEKKETWEKIDLLEDIKCISFSPDGNIYAAADLGYSSLYKSKDNGKNWEQINKDFFFPRVITRIVFTSKGYIICNSYTYSVSISKDGGNSWELKRANCLTIGLCFNSEGHLFGGGDYGSLTRSTDEGETWELMREEDRNFTQNDVLKIIFHPKKSIGYALGQDFLGITTDNGRTWTFPKKKYRDDYLYTGTVDSSGNIFIKGSKNLYVHLNYEDTLRVIKHNFIFTVLDMQTAPDGTIYASVEYGGLYRFRFDLIDGLSVEEVQPSPLFTFPNPAGDYIEIDVGANGRSPLPQDEIRVYNSIGEYVMVTGNVRAIHEPEQSGDQQSSLPLRIDISELPPGIYFLRCGGQTSKFVKM